MKPLTSLMLVSVALVSGAWVGQACAANQNTMLSEVQAVEHARFKAWIAADAAAIGPMIGDDVVYCHSNALCQNKKELIEFVTSGKQRYLAMDVVSMKARDVDGAVVINGKLNMRADTNGKVEEFQIVYTDIYAKRKGKWVLVSWQSTRLP